MSITLHNAGTGTAAASRSVIDAIAEGIDSGTVCRSEGEAAMSFWALRTVLGPAAWSRATYERRLRTLRRLGIDTSAIPRHPDRET